MDSRNDEVIDLFSEVQERIDELHDSDALLDPKNRRPFMSTFLMCREELKYAKRENLLVRRAALKKIIENDYKTWESKLIKVGMGFIPTHP